MNENNNVNNNEPKKNTEARKNNKVAIIIVIIVIALVLLPLLFFGVFLLLGIFVFGTISSDMPKIEPHIEIHDDGNWSQSYDDVEEDDDDEEAPKEDKVIHMNESFIHSYEKIMDKITELKDRKLVDEFYATELTNQQILRIGFQNETIASRDSFTSNELRLNIERQLGKLTYFDESILCEIDNTPTYKYDSSQKIYTAVREGHGHDGPSSYISKKYFDDAILNEDKGTLVISYKILYYGYCTGTCSPAPNIYVSAKDNKEEKNGLLPHDLKGSDYDTLNLDDVYKQNKNNIPITEYTFEKSTNGNYVFKSVVTK